jgi:pyruvate/2-oxoglutarate/acetoin dehydrogenase E1 component
VPLDRQTIAASVERTHRLVVVQESSAGGSWGATLIALLMPDRFTALDAPPLLLAADDTPIPYASALEAAWMPTTEKIASAVRQTLSF